MPTQIIAKPHSSSRHVAEHRVEDAGRGSASRSPGRSATSPRCRCWSGSGWRCCGRPGRQPRWIGSDRIRSTMPLSMSAVSPMATMNEAKAIVWRHDPGHQPLAVAGLRRRDRDRAAEDEGEQQHEHHRLDGDVHQHLGHPLDVDQVAPGDRQRLAEQAGAARISGRSSVACIGSSSWSSAPRPRSSVGSSARWPVRCRNTSSRLGRLSPRSSSSMPLPSKTAGDPGHVGRARRPGRVSWRAPSSTWTSRTSGAQQRLGRGEVVGVRDVTTTAAAPGLVLELRAACPRR